MTTRIILSKHRATWVYTSINDVGGSFGSNHCGTKGVALSKAAIGVQPGQRFELVTNGRSEGLWTVNDDGKVVRDG